MNNPERNLALMAEFESEVVRRQETPQVGWIFNLSEVRVEIPGNFLVIESLRHGLWLCLKLSMSVRNLAMFDTIVDGDEAPGIGFPFLVECWNVITLHEEDMGGLFFEPRLAPQTLDVICRLFHAYQNTGVVPSDLPQFTGRKIPVKGEIAYRFRLRERLVVEKLIRKYHFID